VSQPLRLHSVSARSSPCVCWTHTVLTLTNSRMP
jgi:hypothetical protein